MSTDAKYHAPAVGTHLAIRRHDEREERRAIVFQSHPDIGLATAVIAEGDDAGRCVPIVDGLPGSFWRVIAPPIAPAVEEAIHKLARLACRSESMAPDHVRLRAAGILSEAGLDLPADVQVKQGAGA